MFILDGGVKSPICGVIVIGIGTFFHSNLSTFYEFIVVKRLEKVLIYIGK